jgi:hypothetical protein
MAAEISHITSDDEAITESNRELLEHILTDLHDALRLLRDQGKMLAAHDALLTEFKPLLDQFRSPLASRLTRRNRGSGV